MKITRRSFLKFLGIAAAAPAAAEVVPAAAPPAVPKGWIDEAIERGLITPNEARAAMYDASWDPHGYGGEAK